MLEPDGAYRLAPGVVLVLGTTGARVVDLAAERELALDDAMATTLERSALQGITALGDAGLRYLGDNGWLRQATGGVDVFLRERLRELDRDFLVAGLTPRQQHAYSCILHAHASRKRFVGRVGQCPVLPETALRRALLVGDAAQVGARRVLCLGDDDFVSVGLAALGHRVTVCDIDDYLLAFLERAASELGLSLTLLDHDLRDPLPPALREPCDVFMTDPMANRDCLEIFVSRGLSALSAGGRGYVAVYAPATSLFSQVAAEMRLPIARWLRRFNRYYTHKLDLHFYESDWVEVRKEDGTVPAVAADATRVPLNLYREDYFQRERSLFALYDQIEDIPRARPLFLQTLVDVFLAHIGARVLHQHCHADDTWSVVHTVLPDGHLTVHVDRARAQLTVEMYPHDVTREAILRELLLSAYKRRLESTRVSVGRGAWDFRAG